MIASARELENHLLQARKAGARGVEVLVEHVDHREVVATRRQNVTDRTWSASIASVRCWDEAGRPGAAAGPPEDVARLIADAVARCATGEPDPAEGPAERLSAITRGLDIDDRRAPLLTAEERVEVVVGNERAAGRETALFETGPFTLREARERRIFANTRGVLHESWGTRYTCHGSLRSVGLRPEVELHGAAAGRSFSSVACLPFGVALGRRAAALSRDAAPIDAPIRVLLPPEATAQLVAWLGERFAEASTHPGTTFIDLGVDGSGPGVLHKRLHLIDDGLAPGGLNTRGFDDRGVPPVPVTLLREGSFDARYVGVREARARDLRPTGHEMMDRLTPSNLILNSGTRSINALLADFGGAVFMIDTLIDLSGVRTVDAEMDVPVHGIVLERGKPRGALRHARLQGNLLTALRQVAAVASDTDRVLHVDAPGLFLDGLRVVGGS
jgi:predicted Zn-dependent protease